MDSKHLSLAAVASLLLSCAPQPRTIVVHNFADFDRQGELVEADIAATRCPHCTSQLEETPARG